MKFMLLLVTLCLAICLASAVKSQGNKARPVLINRPTITEFGPMVDRGKRSVWPGVKGGDRRSEPPSSLELNLKKGEFICNGRVCKLKPGEEPKGCNGECQHPV